MKSSDNDRLSENLGRVSDDDAGLFLDALWAFWLGYINVRGEKWKFFFPVTTCILISIVLTGLLWIVR